MPWTIRIALITAGVLLTVSAVGLWTTRPADLGARPARLRLGVLPGRSEAELRRTHGPLVERLSRRTDIPCELVISKDYEELVALFGRGEVDLAWLGALTFIDANDQFGALPLVMRDVDARFTTVFVVRPEDADTPLSERRGQKMGFASRRSTSGHLMAREHLRLAGWEPKDLDSSHFHATHDETVYHVRDKGADIGAVSGLLMKELYESGKLSPNEVVILDRSDPYVDYVWAAQPTLQPDVCRKIREALLELDPLNDEDAHILKLEQCTGYLPARLDEFERVRRIASELKFLDAD